MMQIVKFKKEHYRNLENSKAIGTVECLINEEYLDALESAPFSRTILKGNEIIACCGAIELWTGRAEVWFMIKKSACIRELINLRKILNLLLNSIPFSRVEASVEAGFLQGHKWLKILGFNRESGVLKGYYPNGASGVLYARVGH